MIQVDLRSTSRYRHINDIHKWNDTLEPSLVPNPRLSGATGCSVEVAASRAFIAGTKAARALCCEYISWALCLQESKISFGQCSVTFCGGPLSVALRSARRGFSSGAQQPLHPPEVNVGLKSHVSDLKPRDTTTRSKACHTTTSNLLIVAKKLPGECEGLGHAMVATTAGKIGHRYQHTSQKA